MQAAKSVTHAAVFPDTLKRATAILVVLFLLSAPASAAPKWLGRVIRVSIVASAALADGYFTQRDVSRGSVEDNPIFGRHPSPVRIYATGAAFWIPVEILVERRKSKKLAWAVDLTGAAIHAYFAARNASLPRPMPSTSRH